jgi:protein-disulfide isomerase
MSVVARPAVVAAILCAAAASSCKAKAPAPAGAAAAAPETVVAEVGGERITIAELDHQLVDRMAQDRVFEMRQKVLDDMVAERLLAQEARRRGVTPEELSRTEIEAKVKPVAEADVADLFSRSGLAARGARLDEYRGRIQKSLQDQRRQERRAAFTDELKARAAVKVTLKEPRAQITIPADAPMLGPAGAPVTMVEFLDYQCPYCHRVQGIVDYILQRYPGKVRFVHRDFPLDSIHPDAMNAARAARCAGEQGRFWEYHRRLLNEPGSQDTANLRLKATAEGLNEAAFTACMASRKHDDAIEEAAAQGRSLNVTGTPTFFINGRRMVGVRSPEEFAKMIDEELKPIG